MPWITYISAEGREARVEVREGTSLMLGAVQNNVRGIDGECGGCLSCATCHVYVAPEWAGRIPPADPMEEDMLESVAAERRPGSRLGCQVLVTQDLDGMRVQLPPTQT